MQQLAAEGTAVETMCLLAGYEVHLRMQQYRAVHGEIDVFTQGVAHVHKNAGFVLGSQTGR